MDRAKYSAGDRVSVMRGGGYGAPSGVFRIVSVLPREDARPQQYRVRSDGENFERVIDEARIEAAPLD